MNSKKLFFCLIVLQCISFNWIKASDFDDSAKETNPLRHVIDDERNIHAHNSSESMMSLADGQSEPEVIFNTAIIDGIFDQQERDIINLIQKNPQENMYNDFISGSLGVVTAGTCLYAGKFLEHASKSQKRIFIIDDLMAAGAANATLQAILPTAFAAVAGIVAWRQVDYYLHAEERSHFVVLEHKFENAFKEIKQDVAKEFAARDKKYTGEYKKIFKYVDDSTHKIVQNLEHELATLQKHQSEQADLIQDIKNDVHENNEHLQERIIRAQQYSETAATKITELQGTIAEYKQNYAAMTATFQKMHPLVMAMHTEMTKGKAHQDLTTINTSQSANSGTDDEREEKEDYNPTTKRLPLKKNKSTWDNIVKSVTGQKSKK